MWFTSVLPSTSRESTLQQQWPTHQQQQHLRPQQGRTILKTTAPSSAGTSLGASSDAGATSWTSTPSTSPQEELQEQLCSAHARVRALETELAGNDLHSRTTSESLERIISASLWIRGPKRLRGAHRQNTTTSQAILVPRPASHVHIKQLHTPVILTVARFLKTLKPSAENAIMVMIGAMLAEMTAQRCRTGIAGATATSTASTTITSTSAMAKRSGTGTAETEKSGETLVIAGIRDEGHAINAITVPLATAGTLAKFWLGQLQRLRLLRV